MITHTFLLALLAGSATAAPAMQQLDTPAESRSIHITRSPSVESSDVKPDASDPFFAPCYDAPNCDVIWSDRLEMWRTNVTDPVKALTRPEYERQRLASGSTASSTEKRQNGQSRTHVRLGDEKTFFGDAFPADIMHAALYNTCDNWGCFRTHEHTVWTQRSEEAYLPDVTQQMYVSCEGGWLDNWDLRNALAELGSEAYAHDYETDHFDRYCNSYVQGDNVIVQCFHAINRFYHANKIRVDNYNENGESRGGFTCRIQGVPEGGGSGMCGRFANLGRTLTSWIPGLGPFLAGILGQVPNDSICFWE